MRKRGIMVAGFSVVCLVLLACGGKTHTIDHPDEPEWVTKGSGAFLGERGKAFFGVGAVTGVRNKALARSTSENRARTDLARIFEIYIVSLLKDYQASTTAGDMTASFEEQDIRETTKGFTKQYIRGAMIVDHWRDPTDGTLYSLAELNMEAFQNGLADMKELDARVRDFVRANADKAFDELAAEEAKHP